MKKPFLLLPLLLILTVFPTRTAFGSGYSYQRTISPCQSSTCPADQTNFTVLVCANSTLGNGNTCPTVTGLNQSGAGAHVKNSNGYDIVFSSTACSSPSLMNWEMEKYVASTGEMVAWVKFSTLHASPDTIYMCYGNSTISTFQGGATGSAWDSNYVAVYHFPDGSTLSGNDSSANGYTLTLFNNPAAGSGQIDGAMNTNTGTSPYGEASTLPWSANSDVTVSFWANTTVHTNNSAFGFTSYGTGASPRFQAHVPYSDGNLYWDYGNATAGSGRVSTSYVSHENVWTYVTLTAKGDGSFQAIYFNGSLAASQNISSPPASGSGLQVAQWAGTNPWIGTMDEFRLSKLARSANWITDEYNNQSAPSTFETYGSESTVPLPPPRLYINFARLLLLLGKLIIK